MAAINTANTNLAAAAAVKSPRNAGDGVGSPQSRRAARPGGSPWTQIVRGESEPIAAVPSSPSGSGSASAAAAVVEPVVAAGSSSSSSPPPSASTSPSPVEEMGGESSDNGSGTNGNAGKRPAWNKPSNGGVEIGPVMGAVSWPALSESTRVPSKSGSEPVKGLSDGSSSSVPLSQGSGVAVPTTTPTQKHLAPTLTPNHTGPLPSPSPRPRTMRRNNSNTSSNGGLSQQQAPASQVIEMAPNTPSPRDNTQRSGFGSQSHNSGDHPPHRNSFRHHRNNGPHPRGDGSHHHNYGGRRDQDRGNQDWNSHRSFNGRDTHMQSPRVGSRVYRPTPPSHTSGPYIPAHVVRPYGHIGFPEMGPQMFYIPSPPFVAPPAFYVPAPPDPQLSAKIVNQIEYYFSNDNLIKDTYLRRNMDDQGWVSIELIANFKKVKDLTEHIPLIVEALRMSSLLELQGEKVRKRDDWMRWPLTHGNSSQDMLAARVHGIALEETSNNTPQSSNQPRMPNGDGTGQYSVQAGSDRSFAGRN